MRAADGLTNVVESGNGGAGEHRLELLLHAGANRGGIGCGNVRGTESGGEHIGGQAARHARIEASGIEAAVASGAGACRRKSAGGLGGSRRRSGAAGETRAIASALVARPKRAIGSADLITGSGWIKRKEFRIWQKKESSEYFTQKKENSDF